MNTYQVYEHIDDRIDADVIHRAVTTSSHLYDASYLSDVEYQINVALFGRFILAVGLTEEVLRAIRSAAMSLRYDLRSEEYQAKNANRLINEVDEALEARKAEGECSVGLVFVFGFHHCR